MLWCHQGRKPTLRNERYRIPRDVHFVARTLLHHNNAVDSPRSKVGPACCMIYIAVRSFGMSSILRTKAPPGTVATHTRVVTPKVSLYTCAILSRSGLTYPKDYGTLKVDATFGFEGTLTRGVAIFKVSADGLSVLMMWQYLHNELMRSYRHFSITRCAYYSSRLSRDFGLREFYHRERRAS